MRMNVKLPAICGALLAATITVAASAAFSEAPLKEAEAAYTVPFLFVPTQEQFNQCTVDNTNHPAKTWAYSADGFYYAWDASAAADNWVFLPAVALSDGTFKFSCQYKTKTDEECFEAYLLSAPNAEESSRVMTLLDVDNYKNTTFVDYLTQFNITTAGNYYIGLHASSDKGKFGIYIKNVAIDVVDQNKPNVPLFKSIDFVGVDGTIVFTLPTTTVGGQALSGNVGLKLELDGTEMELDTPLSGAPGSDVTLNYTFQRGDHVMKAYATYGELISEAEQSSFKVTKLQPKPLPVPLFFECDEDEFSWCTILDVNADDKTWAFANTGNPDNTPSFRYAYSSSKDADDWIILPAIGITEAGVYDFGMNVATKYDLEGLEVAWAKSMDVDALKDGVFMVLNPLKTSGYWQQFDGKILVDEPGEIYLALHAISEKYKSYIYVQNITLDKGTGAMPVAPVYKDIDMDGGNGTATFTAPAKAFDGSSMEGETLIMAFTLDGTALDPVNAVAGSDVTLQLTDLAKGMHTLSVTAARTVDGETLLSDPTAIDFKVGLPKNFAYTLPMELNLSTDFDDITVLDVNNDGSTWTNYEGNLRYNYNGSNQADDWVFTAPIEITADDIKHLIGLSIDARGQSTSYNETFDICFATAPTPEAMADHVVMSEVVNYTQFTTLQTSFLVSDPGHYYVGIHATSPKNLYNLYINNLKVFESELEVETPAAVTEITATPDQTGANKATVTFTLPTLTVPGADLAADVELTATVTSAVESKTLTGLPGAELTTEIETVEGENLISVVVANEKGNGPSASVSVRTGLDKPKAPAGLTAEVQKDNMSVVLTWLPVTEGQTGGVVNAPAMRYRIYEYDADDEDVYLVDDTDQTTYTYTAEGMNSMAEVILVVDAYNAPNSGSGYNSVNVVLGKPYSLPMSETFAGGKIHYRPFVATSTLPVDYQPSWQVANPTSVNSGATTSTGYALIGHTSMNRGDSQVWIPKFSTKNVTASSDDMIYDGVEFSTSIFINPQTPEFTFYASSFGVEKKELAKVDATLTPGWHDVAVTLSDDLMDLTWLSISMDVNFVQGSSNYAIVSGYGVNILEHSGLAENVAAKGDALRVVKGGIELTGMDAEQLVICDMAGHVLMQREVPSDRFIVTLEPGYYVVRAGSVAKTVRIN